jgi:protein-disulfide isomerase
VDTPIAEWDALTAAGVAMGPNSATLTIVEFMDFECPYCARFAAEVATLRMEFPEDVKVILHHLPLGQHKFARPAASAFECAAVQGQTEQMYAHLFARQDSFGLKPWRDYARDSFVPDLGAFDSCMKNAVFPRIESGKQFAAGIGASGTPTVIVNGWKLARTPDAASLRKMLAAVERGELRTGVSPAPGMR